MDRSKCRSLATWRTTLALLLTIAGSRYASSQERFKAPKIWDTKELYDWSLPIAAIKARPNFVSEAAYYASPVDNLRTYPVYHPDHEPEDYKKWLREQDPQPLVEPGKARTTPEWINLGKRVFEEWDTKLVRTTDPEAIAFLEDREALEKDGITVAGDGTIPGFRWVVEARGKVSLGLVECTGCHLRVMDDGTSILGAPGNLRGGGVALEKLLERFREYYGTKDGKKVSPAEEAYYDYHVPWLQNDIHASLKSMSDEEAEQIFASGIPGTLARVNGSPYWTTKMPDLRGVKDQKYLDSTGTHRNRGPEDVARYAALVVYADDNSFGRYHTLPETAHRPVFHVPDDVLYALGMYCYSLEPLQNPKIKELDPAWVERGKVIFEEQDCARCHAGRNLGGEKLTPAVGFEIPENYYEQFEILDESAETDPNLALKTRKGTGLYKVPSLKGLWYRGLFGHSGSCATLEDWFDPARLQDDYVPTGWKGPGVERRSIPGHEFGLDLSSDDKQALIAFLRTL